MSVPLANTTVTITRNVYAGTPTPDPLDSTPTVQTVASGARATIAPPKSAKETLIRGDHVVYESELVCDPTALQVADFVLDNSTGLTWSVLWVTQVTSLGMNHTQAGLRRLTGGDDA
jgi:hypothetical protein